MGARLGRHLKRPQHQSLGAADDLVVSWKFWLKTIRKLTPTGQAAPPVIPPPTVLELMGTDPGQPPRGHPGMLSADPADAGSSWPASSSWPSLPADARMSRYTFRPVIVSSPHQASAC